MYKTLTRLLAKFLFVIICFTAHAEVTPSDVYAQVQTVLNNLNQLVKDKNQYAGFNVSDAQPLHVYAMATALNEKVAILNDLVGVDANNIKRPSFPNTEIKPHHVLKMVKAIQTNLLLRYPDMTFNPIKTSGKEPANVLRLILACNMALDNILKDKITPDYPYTMVDRLRALLTKQTKITAPLVDSHLYGEVEPRDVFVVAESILKIFMNTAHVTLQTKYPSQPYYIPADRNNIQPIDVFTLSVMNWVLLMDITHEAIPNDINWRHADKEHMTPANVYAAYQQVIYLSSYFLLTNHQTITP